MIKIPKGVKDVLPQESYKWQYVESVARRICRLSGVKEIRTPTFEHTELFTRSIGDDTDVVSKEMYTFADKRGRSLTLKPEGTACVARSYVENSLESNSLPLKMFYFTPVFRYENPQAGRYREHHQFGVEVYGAAAPVMDYEVIKIAYDFLSALNISGLELHLNSIGCPTCRARYNAALKDFLKSRLNALCPTCRERFERNPLRIIDCKVPGCKEIVKSAPRIIDFICEDCKAHMDSLCHYLNEAKIPYSIDADIVRGLDYYTKTVFEFVTTALGAQGTVCGGGRYDSLVESVGGKPTPCVGFGLGLERLIMLMDSLSIPFGEKNDIDVFVMSQSAAFTDECLKLVRELRGAGIAADADYTGRSLKAQFKYADKISAGYAVVIGENEVTSGLLNVKKLSDGTTVSVSRVHIVEHLSKAVLDS